MATGRVAHRCSSCGTPSATWVGRCPSCDEWGTVVAGAPKAQGRAAPLGAAVALRAEVDEAQPACRATGVGELDRVLGGGLVADSVTLVGGEPGVGKSTLILQAVAGLAERGARVLYVSAEESVAQVRGRAHRLGLAGDGVSVVADRSVDDIVGQIDAVDAEVVVVDSIQTVHHPAHPSVPGSPVQVRECAQALVTEAKRRPVTVVLVGHVTKDGSLAGPRHLEHVVDTVVSVEGDRHHGLRLVRAVKHRFGTTAELGVLEMTGQGLVGVSDPSALFLADRRRGVTGSVVAPVLDGRRPLLVEVQALVAPSTLAQPRRTAQGLDGGRLSLLLAVLARRAGVRVGDADVYAAVAGGAKVAEPAVDLAVALAVVSSQLDAVAPDDAVAIGEIGLGGEIRGVAQVEQRLVEAQRHGFGRALVPPSAPDGPPGFAVTRVATLGEALAAAGWG